MMPNPTDMAIGITYCACTLFSRRIGNKPAAVVIDVKTERNAPTPVEPYHDGLEAWSYHE